MCVGGDGHIQSGRVDGQDQLRASRGTLDGPGLYHPRTGGHIQRRQSMAPAVTLLLSHSIGTGPWGPG
jgi:hypothetical protein